MGVLLIGGIFGMLAYSIMYVIVSAMPLPHTMFPEAIVTRPYDAL
jgi:hypothetical protein